MFIETVDAAKLLFSLSLALSIKLSFSLSQTLSVKTLGSLHPQSFYSLASCLGVG
jgi:hypothetical protein